MSLEGDLRSPPKFERLIPFPLFSAIGFFNNQPLVFQKEGSIPHSDLNLWFCARVVTPRAFVPRAWMEVPPEMCGMTHQPLYEIRGVFFSLGEMWLESDHFWRGPHPYE